MSLDSVILNLERLLARILTASPAVLIVLLGWLTIIVSMCCPSTRTFVLEVLRLVVSGIQAWQGGQPPANT